MSKKTPMDKDRILALRIRSKCGGALLPSELEELGRAYRQWPEEYAALNDEVNDAAYEHVTGVPRRS